MSLNLIREPHAYQPAVSRSAAGALAMNISRRREFGRYSMNLAMEQERLQGWLSVASVETGKTKRVFGIATLSQVQLFI